MNTKPELERRFLVEFPETDRLNCIRKAEIIQTYLQNGQNNSQRRVRQIKEGSEVKYTYTEKIFVTAIVRQETEFEINESEYKTLISEAKKDCVPIQKTRYCFDYKNQMFELDKYPFSDELAILELELKDPNQEIYFPDNINVIREVTGEKRYSNASVANAGGFPKQL